MIVPIETLGVDLVDIFGARRSGGEPAILGGDLDAADGRVVAGCTVKHSRDRFTGEFVRGNVRGLQSGKLLLCAAFAGASTRSATGSPSCCTNSA